MNQPNDTTRSSAQVPPSAPTIEIRADQIEVIAADAPAGAAPIKAAEVRSTTIGPKDVLPGKKTQFYHPVEKPSRLLGVELDAGVVLHQIMAGVETLDFSDGRSFPEAYPDGVDVAGGIYLTSVIRNPGDQPVRARVVYVLRERAAAPGEGAVTPSARSSGRPENRTDGSRPMGGPPRATGGKRTGPGPVLSANSAKVRVGPKKRRSEPGPKRTQHSRVAGSTQAPGVRRPNAAVPPPVTQMRRPDDRESRVQAASAPAGPIEVGEGEVAITIERFRLPAVRDLARREVPVPPDHVGALQRALRKPGEGPGEPVVMSRALAERLLKVLTSGGRLTSDERSELGRALEGERPPPVATDQPVESPAVEASAVEESAT